ncbi:MAG: type II secretion system F family protein [Candidatus Nanohaloarchaea archaeon]|nr:type II secretion system F family protein [Candidatus Nanohaloarchaea archaeon]
MLESVRSFVRRYSKEIKVLLLSLSIAAAILGLNLWSYDQHTDIFSVSTKDVDERILTVERGRPAKVVFPIKNPGLASSTLKIEFSEVGSGSSFDISVNGNKIKEGISGLSNGSVQSLSVDPSSLGRSNTLLVEGKFDLSGRLNARIERIKIEGFSAFRRAVFLLLNFLAIVVGLGPFLWMKYLEYSYRSELETHFPDWMRDVVEGVRSGMSLPQSIKNTRSGDYGALSEEIDEMYARLDWGVSFEKVMTDFAESSGSRVIRRAVNTVVQAYRSGGDIAEILESVGSNLKEVKKLREERRSQLYGEVVTGYIVYFLFIGVLVMLLNFLMPSLGFQGNIGPLGGGGLSAEQLITRYRPLFRNLIIIQSVFSGLVIGKLSEGEIRAGAKHSAILLAVGYTISILLM